MPHLMLDTNTISDLIKGHDRVLARMETLDPTECCISAVTAAEIAYGLAKRPDATTVHRLTRAVMARLDVRPWDATVAHRYGTLRATQEQQGRTLAALDLMIAAHALALNLPLATSDRAFRSVDGLAVQDFRTE